MADPLIPEIKLTLTTTVIKAKPRKLKCKWRIEQAAEFQVYYCVETFKDRAIFFLSRVYEIVVGKGSWSRVQKLWGWLRPAPSLEDELCAQMVKAKAEEN